MDRTVAACPTYEMGRITQGAETLRLSIGGIRVAVESAAADLQMTVPNEELLQQVTRANALRSNMR